MKKIFIAFLLGLVTSVSIEAQNQTVVWKDDFSGDKGWKTFTYKNQYSAEYTKDGQLMIKSEADQACMSTCRTTLNPQKNFTISVEATSKSGLKDDSFFGIAFNVLDFDNYYCFAVEKGFAYFDEIREGKRVRHNYDDIKNTKAKVFTLEVKKTGTTVVFIINGEETSYIENIEVKSSKVALYVAGKTQVAFDNMEIKQ